MDFEAKALVALIGLLVLIGLVGGAYWEGHHAGVQEIKAEDNAAIVKAQKDNQDLVNQLEVQHENANAALNVLLSAPAPVVRVPQCTSKAVTAPGSVLPTSPAQRTSDPVQAAFDDFTKSMESDAAEWSDALNSCRAVMDWAKAQN